MSSFRIPYCTDDQKPEWELRNHSLVLLCIPKTANDHHLDAIDRTFFWMIYGILFGMFLIWMIRKSRGVSRQPLFIRNRRIYDSMV